MSRRNRDRKPARRPNTIEARQRILVLCEGKRTEPEYIAGFKNWCRNPLVEVAILGAEGVPLTLVTNARDCQSRAADAAKREKDENLLYDQVWCIFAFRNPSTGVYRLTEQIGRYSWLEARSHDTDSSSSMQHVNPDTTRQGPRSREAR